MTKKSVAPRAKLVGGRLWQHTLPPNCPNLDFIASRGTSPQHLVSVVTAKHKVAGGQRGRQDGMNTNGGITTLSANREAAMSHAGEIDQYRS